MVRSGRWWTLILLLALPGSPVRGADGGDGIILTVGKDEAGQVRLDWSGARPAFELFRSSSAPRLTEAAGNRLSLTRERHLTDVPPEGPITFYTVVPRWPQFFSSDAAHDDALNDLFIRHARADQADDSLRRDGSPVAGMWTTTLWRDWEVDELMWHDYSTANFPLDQRPWFTSYFTALTPVDKFGYYFSGGPGPEAASGSPGNEYGLGWPFPSYSDSRGLSVGWEWNGSTTEGWTLINARNDGVASGEWRSSTTQAGPQIISPKIQVDAFQAPIIGLEIQYDAIDPKATSAERIWRLYWQTSEDPTWALSRSVTSNQFPVQPAGSFLPGVSLGTQFLPMHLHPQWNGKTITRLRLDPLETTAARTARWRLNFVRLDYDTRESINNPTFIRFVARKFFWEGDGGYLAGQLTRMRQATQFMLTHMRAGELNLLDHSWFVGHDGLGFAGIDQPRIGHGLQNNWFDIVTTGPRDLIACVKYYLALQAMAEVEAFIDTHPEWDAPRPTVIGPDGSTSVPYLETAASLRARLEPTRRAIHAEFWNAETGRYGGWRTAAGLLVDYGTIQANLEALAAGIPEPEAARSILDWLDGSRIVEGDTSTGADLYVNRFAARTNARKNNFDWIWGWTGWTVPFSDQVEDGGSALYTTFFDVKGRLRYSDRAGAWTVWNRMLDHHRTVRAFGGVGANFYRDYYAAHPELGYLQGGGVPGGLGLDCEFVENSLVPAAWPLAWLGIETNLPGVLRIAPTLPDPLQEIGIRSLIYRGHRLDIRSRRGVIDLADSTVLDGAGESLELFFAGVTSPTAEVRRDGLPAPGELSRAPDGLTLRTPITAGRFEVVDEGRER